MCVWWSIRASLASDSPQPAYFAQAASPPSVWTIRVRLYEKPIMVFSLWEEPPPRSGVQA